MLGPGLYAMLACVVALVTQNDSAPVPEKTDVPYLRHADDLIEPEIVTAREQSQKDGITYIIEGSSSRVKTPLASPIFVIRPDKLNPERLQVYQLQPQGSHREITFYEKKKSKNPKPYTVTVKKLSEGVFRLEVNESLPRGEYSLTPSDSNQAFCFTVE